MIDDTWKKGTWLIKQQADRKKVVNIFPITPSQRKACHSS